uniref:Uncharacterized protein n=1 Tax=Anopheles darlingi TaxID=43151 RepID=A0A2M4D0F8_ANODA
MPAPRALRCTRMLKSPQFSVSIAVAALAPVSAAVVLVHRKRIWMLPVRAFPKICSKPPSSSVPLCRRSIAA